MRVREDKSFPNGLTTAKSEFSGLKRISAIVSRWSSLFSQSKMVKRMDLNLSPFEKNLGPAASGGKGNWAKSECNYTPCVFASLPSLCAWDTVHVVLNAVRYVLKN